MIRTNSTLNAAISLRKSIGWGNPSDYTLDIVANSLGINIKEVPINGSEGRILVSGDHGIISINSNIVSQTRKNFIIAHEIGHFTLHKDLMFCSDTHKTLSDWHKKGPQEAQANEFASELLMPSDQYISQISKKRMSLALMEEVSSYFNVSILAAFLKYVSLGEYPSMVIYMEKGIVKWKICSSDFPFQFLPLNTAVPAYTVAGDYFYNNSDEPQPEKIDAIEWFPEDFQIKFKKDWKLWEQCYKTSEDGLVSCLWTF